MYMYTVPVSLTQGIYMYMNHVIDNDWLTQSMTSHVAGNFCQFKLFSTHTELCVKFRSENHLANIHADFVRNIFIPVLKERVSLKLYWYTVQYSTNAIGDTVGS